MRHLATMLLCAFGVPALATDASDPAERAKHFAEAALQGWASDPMLIAAVRDQNSRHAGLTPADIAALDQRWIGELGKPVQPTISSILTAAPSDLLRAQVELAAGLMTEVFVMDALGLNVAASSITSDYWQGDEAKFSETFPKGAGAIHVGEVDFDESTQVYQIQVSFSLTDPADGTVVGAITVALNAEQL